MKKKDRGFTLIELMITIAVLAVITAMAVPQVRDMRLKQNFNRSVQELSGVLKEARSKAILERRDITVTLQTSEIAGLPPDTVTNLNWMPYGTSLLDPTSPTSITFDLTGGVKNAASDTSLKICADVIGDARTITISRMGMVQQISEGVC